jgi:aspartate/methionine/tyrosine aminotransferase
MKLEPFVMERMQSEWENRVPHNLSESGVHPLSVEELLDGPEREALLKERLVYVQSNGTEALRTAIAALHRGATADDVVVTNGTAEANFVAAWRLVEPGDEVVMVLPNYMQLWGVLRAFGAKVVEAPLAEKGGRWTLDPDRLPIGSATRLVVVCNPNNPTGAVLSEEERKGLLEKVAKHGAWLLVDEVYRGAEREREETQTFFGSYERVLVSGGMSKAYGLPGLRIGWLLSPRSLAPELWGRKDYTTISPGALSDHLARVALRKRDRILDRTRGILRANYPVLASWAESRKGAFRFSAPDAGAIAYIQYAYKVNSTKLVERLRDEQGVLIVPGDHFGMDGYLRVGFGNEPHDLRNGLARIDALLDRLPA